MRIIYALFFVAGLCFAAPRYKSLVKNVTTAGTRVALNATELYSPQVTIKAKSGNSGTIYVGDVTVSSSNGYALAAGQSVTLGDLVSAQKTTKGQAINLNEVYLDASSNGEGVTVLYAYVNGW